MHGCWMSSGWHTLYFQGLQRLSTRMCFPWTNQCNSIHISDAIPQLPLSKNICYVSSSQTTFLDLQCPSDSLQRNEGNLQCVFCTLRMANFQTFLAQILMVLAHMQASMKRKKKCTVLGKERNVPNRVQKCQKRDLAARNVAGQTKMKKKKKLINVYATLHEMWRWVCTGPQFVVQKQKTSQPAAQIKSFKTKDVGVSLKLELHNHSTNDFVATEPFMFVLRCEQTTLLNQCCSLDCTG